MGRSSAIGLLSLTDGLPRFLIDRLQARNLSLVVKLAAPGKCELALEPAILQVKAKGHQRQPFFGRPSDQFANLAAVEQKFSRPQRIMVRVGTMRIRANVAIKKPDLSGLDQAIGVFQIHTTISRGLDLGSRQNNPGFKLLDNFVVVECLPVYRNILHRSAIAGIVEGRWLRTEQTVWWIALRLRPQRSL